MCVKIQFDVEMFKSVINELPMMRFDNVIQLNTYISDKLNFNPKLLDGEPLEDYDDRLVSNCTVNDYDLCYLDIYYIVDNKNRYFITEVSMDFST